MPPNTALSVPAISLSSSFRHMYELEFPRHRNLSMEVNDYDLLGELDKELWKSRDDLHTMAAYAPDQSCKPWQGDFRIPFPHGSGIFQKSAYFKNGPILKIGLFQKSAYFKNWPI